jgi:hypothetical protein
LHFGDWRKIKKNINPQANILDIILSPNTHRRYYFCCGYNYHLFDSC